MYYFVIWVNPWDWYELIHVVLTESTVVSFHSVPFVHTGQALIFWNNYFPSLWRHCFVSDTYNTVLKLMPQMKNRKKVYWNSYIPSFPLVAQRRTINPNLHLLYFWQLLSSAPSSEGSVSSWRSFLNSCCCSLWRWGESQSWGPGNLRPSVHCGWLSPCRSPDCCWTPQGPDQRRNGPDWLNWNWAA